MKVWHPSLLREIPSASNPFFVLDTYGNSGSGETHYVHRLGFIRQLTADYVPRDGRVSSKSAEIRSCCHGDHNFKRRPIRSRVTDPGKFDPRPNRNAQSAANASSVRNALPWRRVAQRPVQCCQRVACGRKVNRAQQRTAHCSSVPVHKR